MANANTICIPKATPDQRLNSTIRVGGLIYGKTSDNANSACYSLIGPGGSKKKSKCGVFCIVGFGN